MDCKDYNIFMAMILFGEWDGLSLYVVFMSRLNLMDSGAILSAIQHYDMKRSLPRRA